MLLCFIRRDVENDFHAMLPFTKLAVDDMGAETGHITIPHAWNISMASFSTSYSFPDHDFHQRSDYVFVFGLVFLLHYSADLIWERRSPRLRLMVALYLLKTAK